MGSAQQDCGSAEIAFEGIGLKKLDPEKIGPEKIGPEKIKPEKLAVVGAQRHGRSRERVG